jgi:hypothetical protein
MDFKNKTMELMDLESHFTPDSYSDLGLEIFDSS